ncbi:TPA: aldehyde dehydrogenase family protein, partial [Klebsiella oxytoca]|nr:aldehyde dehydrogenase family protein [Klebsiella oxytoca]
MNVSATHAVSVNPTTGETISSLPWASEQEVDSAVALAEQAYRQWRNVSVAERAAALRHVGNAMRARGEALAQMISLEMGKPIAQARGEVAKSANLCDWYAEHGPAMLKTEATLVEDNKAVIEYRPMGA